MISSENVFTSLCRIILFSLFFLFSPFLHPGQSYQDNHLTPEKLIENIQTKSFTGQKIDFIFSNKTINEMIDHLELVSGIRFDLDPEIKAQATYHLQQVPWDQALAAILTDHELNIDLDQDSIKIYRGRKFVLAFHDQKKARIFIFFYRHFHLILISIIILFAGIIGFILIRKSKAKRNRIQKKDLLSREQVEAIEKELSYLLEIRKIYRDQSLTLISLSDMLKISPHQLSWVINQKMKKSFPSLINLHRIEEVKTKLTMPSQNETTILQSAFEAGFGTKTSFNKAFKKITGLTPSQYRDKHMHKNKPASFPEY
jgi:AraC-like DNA-binding protein